MKKSTILIIAVVFAASIFMVGVFGIKNVPYQEIVYVEEIKLTQVMTAHNNEEVKVNKDDMGYYIRVPYVKDLTIIVSYEINPYDATNRSVSVTVDKLNNNSDAELSASGAIVLHDSGAIKVTYAATDAPGAPTIVLSIYTYVE